MKIELPPFAQEQLATIGTMLGLQCPISLEFLKVQLENTILFDRKQQDYGPSNIATFGEIGVVIRAQDKLSRLANLLKSKRKKSKNEPIEDSYRDLSNYGTIGLLLRTNRWM